MDIFTVPSFDPKTYVPKLASLTTRQKELVQLLLDCRKREDIATFYGISNKGLDWHIYRLFSAVGVSSIVQLVIVAATANFHFDVQPRNLSAPLAEASGEHPPSQPTQDLAIHGLPPSKHEQPMAS